MKKVLLFLLIIIGISCSQISTVEVVMDPEDLEFFDNVGLKYEFIGDFIEGEDYIGIATVECSEKDNLIDVTIPTYIKVKADANVDAFMDDLLNDSQYQLSDKEKEQLKLFCKKPFLVTEIRLCGFEDCASLKKIEIANSVTKIGSFAFKGCRSLKEIVLPNTLSEIESFTFQNSSAIEEITIPKSVSKIGDFAFSGCSSLKSVTMESKMPPTIDGAYVFSNTSRDLTIYVPEEAVEAYRNAPYWRSLKIWYKQ